MRRSLALFLVGIMLFSFIPINVEGSSYAKEIDAIFGDFQLKVNNKRINGHKESFIYDDTLYVSLLDLAEGLELGVSLRGNTVNITSKGKINSSSNQSILFQRGYEIEAKERLLEILDDELRALNGKGSAGIKYEMKYSTRSIKVGFGNLTVYLDGKKLNLDSKVLRFNNDIYVGLDTIAPFLYITPSVSKDKTAINIDSNGILVKHNSFASAEALLSMREGRNYLLDIQRAELEMKKTLLEEYNLPYKKVKNIADLEDYLNKYFKNIGDVDVKFHVVKQSNWINLDISFSASQNLLWYRLKRSDVESWIWRVYTAILQIYDDEALISGVVRNPYYASHSNSSLKNYVTFYTKDSDIYFDFSKSRLGVDDGVNPGYLMEILNIYLSKYADIDFSYDASMSGNNLSLIVRPDSKNFSQMSIYTKMGYLKSLKERIRTYYPNINVDGRIVYPDDKIFPLNFYISENRVRSTDLMDETIKYLNISHGHFSHGNNDFNLNYSLYEKDLKDFNLYVIGDFYVGDDKWIDAGAVGENLLNIKIHNAISFIASLWDANISTEVVDKEGTVIKEFDIYQENVSVVSANPPSGEIVEGSKVVLSTDTSGAGIYYTLDGSTPTLNSNLYYGGGIEVTKDMVINAFGHKDGFGSGPISTFNYTVVKDTGLSDGLTDLVIDSGTLSPGFARNNHQYTVSVDNGVDSISITPRGKGVIKINGLNATSGQATSVALKDGGNTITIGVKEDNKRERVYTIVVNKEVGGAKDVFSIEVGLYNASTTSSSFNIFSGKIMSNNVTDFSSYEIKLVTKSGIERASGDVKSNGEFSLTGFNIDFIDKLFGIDYKVLDNGGREVLSGELK